MHRLDRDFRNGCATEVDAAERPGVTTQESAELCVLRSEVLSSRAEDICQQCDNYATTV